MAANLIACYELQQLPQRLLLPHFAFSKRSVIHYLALSDLNFDRQTNPLRLYILSSSWYPPGIQTRYPPRSRSRLAAACSTRRLLVLSAI